MLNASGPNLNEWKFIQNIVLRKYKNSVILNLNHDWLTLNKTFNYIIIGCTENIHKNPTKRDISLS